MPGIYFADEPAGREAKVAGTGLGVWEVIRDYLAAGKDERALRKSFPRLSAGQVRACLMYYRKYSGEIDAEIAENAAVTRKALPGQISGPGAHPVKFHLDEDLPPQISERLRKRGFDAIRRQEPHAGIIFCPPSLRGFEVGAIVDALARVAKRFPEGLGEYEVLYL